MTPDVVASYDPVLPEADFIKRDGDGADARRDQALHRHRDEEGHDAAARSCCRARPMTPRQHRPHRRASGSSTSCRSWTRSSSRTAISASTRTFAACTIPKAQFVMNRPIVGPAQQHRHRREHRRLRHHRLAGEERAGSQRQGRRSSARPTSASPTLLAEINPHPALKAAVPQSPMVDGWMGDDWFHNGAFRVSALRLRGLRRAPARPTAAAIAARRGRRLHALSRGGIDGRLCAKCWASTTIRSSRS